MPTAIYLAQKMGAQLGFGKVLFECLSKKEKSHRIKERGGIGIKFLWLFCWYKGSKAARIRVLESAFRGRK
jgi:hypothetical protein